MNKIIKSILTNSTIPVCNNNYMFKNSKYNYSKFTKYVKEKCCPCPEPPKKRPKIVRAKTCVQCCFWERTKVEPVCIVAERKVAKPVKKGPCKPVEATFCNQPVKRRRCKAKYAQCPQGYEKMKY